jgi:alpha-L-rhamnosidase
MCKSPPTCRIARLCLGCMRHGKVKAVPWLGMLNWPWTLNEDGRHSFLRHAVGLGINFSDTATVTALSLISRVFAAAAGTRAGNDSQCFWHIGRAGDTRDFAGGVLNATDVLKKHLQRICLLIIVFVHLFLTGNCHGSSIELTDLKCEYRVNPLGIDTSHPRLSWIIESQHRGERQIAYQILAWSSETVLSKNKGSLWDSGRVVSDETLGVVFAGQSLHSGQRVYWKVRIWNGDGTVSSFSQPAWFETALLNPTDWRGAWIERRLSQTTSEAHAFDDHPAPQFRKQFELKREIKSARAYVTGLGYFELSINGHRVGKDVLNPGWTSYVKRVLYSTYDVTQLLKRGQNAVGIMLGNGWFNPLPLAMWGRIRPGDALTTGEPRALLQLVVEFTDGTAQIIGTDDSWRVADGPVMRNSVYLGEFYDARREQTGWDRPGFDDSKWDQAVLADQPRLGLLKAQDAPPIHVTRVFKTVKLTEPKPGMFIFDFGQNFAGWARLHVKGPRGTCVRLRSGELLYPDGTLNGMTAIVGQIKDGGKDYTYDGIGQPKTAFQLDQYILKGHGTEVYTPRFTFHGFRYVEVTGFPGKPTLDSLEGLGLNSDVSRAGTFECSNDLFNRIQKMVVQTELANLFSVQSDCPHREKFGYGGDLAVTSEMGMLNFDMSSFYAKVAGDFVDAQRTNGGFTETAPFVGISDQHLSDSKQVVGLGGAAGPVDWGVAQPLLAWQLFQYYGNRRVMRHQYEATKHWIALLRSKAVDNLLDNGISDHESLDPKPRFLTGSAFYYYNVKLFAQIARELGHENDAREAELQAEQIKAAFNHEFLKSSTGCYDTGSQACQSFALYFGMVPPAEEAHALDVLVRDIQVHQGHLSTGIFGTKYMLDKLTDLGRADVACQMVSQRTFPGWGYMLENGATTLWEHWALDDEIYSHDHPMFGSVSEWFYKALAGIRPAQDAVGFNKIIIAPQPVGDLKWVKGSYDSVRGRIVSEWFKSKGQFQLHLRIPVGSTAVVLLPAKNPDRITEGGQGIEHRRGIEFQGMKDGKAVFTITSGEYTFISTI